jgi:3-deoxy-D-manno-octulosonic-acid transferase
MKGSRATVAPGPHWPLSSRVALWLYGWLMRLLSPFYALRLWRRGAREALYRQHWGQRWGWYGHQPLETLPQPACVWVHAVSLGETRAAAALLEALRALDPGMKVLLTHSTATGREAGRALLRPGDAQLWLPFDTPGAVRRFLALAQPRLGVLMETELWPQLMHEAGRRGLPMVLANARLSERSARRGRALGALLRPAAHALHLVLAQTDSDANRLRAAGAKRVQVCGNLKFDMSPDPAQSERGLAWKAQHQARSARPVVMAASTREGEEAALLQAWRQRFFAAPPDSNADEGLQAQAARPVLLLVPRHPQRFDEVAAVLAAQGWRWERRCGWGANCLPLQPDTDVLLGDSLGEMALYGHMADLALLGGSFAPLGGQNLIELAACGCPVVMGPHTFNFTQACEWALQAGAAWRVQSWHEALQQAERLLQPSSGARSEREGAAVNALRFARQHQGAARLMAQAIVQADAQADVQANVQADARAISQPRA